MLTSSVGNTGQPAVWKWIGLTLEIYADVTVWTPSPWKLLRRTSSSNKGLREVRTQTVHLSIRHGRLTGCQCRTKTLLCVCPTSEF
jgi:hypothetical protein